MQKGALGDPEHVLRPSRPLSSRSCDASRPGTALCLEDRPPDIPEAGKIYVGTQNGKVVCIDTGDPKFTGWSYWGGNVGHTGLPK